MFTGWWEIFEKNRECMTRKECRKIIKRGWGVGGVGWGLDPGRSYAWLNFWLIEG